jgi:hypothetical protein
MHGKNNNKAMITVFSENALSFRRKSLNRKESKIRNELKPMKYLIYTAATI